jgi:hypothetical protein
MDQHNINPLDDFASKESRTFSSNSRRVMTATTSRPSGENIAAVDSIRIALEHAA